MDALKRSEQTRVSVFILLFLLLAAGIVTVGYLHYRNYERQYRSEVEGQLSAIADLKVSQSAQWRKERLADGGILFKNTELANRTQPAPVILDIQLPQMDGFTGARELKRNPSLRDVSIVAETSYAMAGDRERTLEAGCNGCIEKPITPDTFKDEIEKHLNTRPSAGGTES